MAVREKGERMSKTVKSALLLPGSAYMYAVDVAKGRWEPGETVIAKDAYWAFAYAINVLKCKNIPQVIEKSICEDGFWSKKYYQAMEKEVQKNGTLWVKPEFPVSKNVEFCPVTQEVIVEEPRAAKELCMVGRKLEF